MDALPRDPFVVTEGEGATLVTLAGDFDIVTAHSIDGRVNAFLASAPTDVVFDMWLVDFIDSSGIALLLRVYTRVVKEGKGSIRVMRASDAARRTFELCGLTEAFGFDAVEISDEG